MGRKPRVEAEGGVYHVIQRGNNREFIFEDDGAKGYLIDQFRILSGGLGYKVYGFVVMGNHYHVILQTFGEPLKSIMHRINLRYSKYFNRKYERSGHVFEGRYKAVSILDEKYLLSLLRYIHQNPVRAGVCQRVEEYRWSSDRVYRENIKEWVDISLIMDMLSGNRKTAIQKYKEFMVEEETVNYEDVKVISDTFDNRDGKENIQEKTGRKSLDDILLSTGVNKKEFELIKNGSRKRILTEYKLLYAMEALKLNYTLKSIGKNIQVSDVALLDMIKRHNLIT